ncbi:MAG: SDR family oxidoreductase [Planctomycetes bacterium]|nr:SDR family oxidoreductase [Planctomycetota bacterium]
MSAYTGKIALVTGGASGIGRALCARLASEGARVVVSDIDGDAAQAFAAELAAAGLTAEGATLDVTDAEAFRDWVQGAAKAHGRIDFLFNNAGIALVGEAHHQTLSDWEPVVRVNLHGVMHGVLAAYPLMVAQGHGHLVNISSVSGLIPAPHFAIYSATKHAVAGLSAALQIEASALGVRVSAVCPGFIETPIMENLQITDFDREKTNAQIKPLAATADSCARAILRGVRRNRPVIVVTGHAKGMVFLQRHAPWLLRLLLRRSVKRMRAHCTSDASPT